MRQLLDIYFINSVAMSLKRVLGGCMHSVRIYAKILEGLCHLSAFKKICMTPLSQPNHSFTKDDFGHYSE